MLPSVSSRSQPLPDKIAARLQETRWLLFGLCGVYVAMVLLGYSKSDPGWSHAAAVSRVANPGGRFGAWLSDLMLYLFGVSAWWWVLFLGLGLVWGYRRLREPGRADRRSVVVVGAGFLLTVVASSALEAMRFHSVQADLPLAAGGLIGTEVGGPSSSTSDSPVVR